MKFSSAENVLLKQISTQQQHVNWCELTNISPNYGVNRLTYPNKKAFISLLIESTKGSKL